MATDALERWRKADGTLVVSDRTPWLVRGLVGVIAFAFAAAAIPIWLSSEFPWWAKPIMAGLGPWTAIHYFVHLLFYTPTYRTVIVPRARTVRVEQNWPNRKAVQPARFEKMRGAEVVESRDSDGDPYFVLSLVLPDGRRIPLDEGHDGTWAHAASAQLDALFAAR